MSVNAESGEEIAVVGLGLIGGSIALRLRQNGWRIIGRDRDVSIVEDALSRGVIDTSNSERTPLITFVATPVSFITDEAQKALLSGGIVTDVGSVKEPVVRSIEDPRFVGGHPMAGSEVNGLPGANADLFEGATWVLTPSRHTGTDTYLKVREVVDQLGAEVVTLDAAEHDEMVATISHVPHLTAAALMTVATDHAYANDAVLRLAAGGFRDMTRIAAGHPRLWADISLANREAISARLDELITRLEDVRELVANSKFEALETLLAEASQARKDLPLRQGRPAEVVSLAIVIPDRPGALAEVFSSFARMKVNVEDVEIAHALEGGRGTLLVTVDGQFGDSVRDALAAKGFRVSLEAL